MEHTLTHPLLCIGYTTHIAYRLFELKLPLLLSRLLMIVSVRFCSESESIDRDWAAVSGGVGGWRLTYDLPTGGVGELGHVLSIK